MRDDFTQETKNLLGNRVGWRCSRPSCGQPTRGPADNELKYNNIGVAAHICAASKGGPRYDINMTSEERKSYNNGIWLCQSCSKLIDSDVDRFTVEEIRQWKRDAEQIAQAALEGRCGFDDEYPHTLIIKSFMVKGEDAKSEQNILFDLTDYFEGRFLKDEYVWSEIVEKIKRGISNNLKKENHYVVKLITHYPIAFIAGRIMNPKSAIKTVPSQNTINGNETWDIQGSENKEYEKLNITKERINEANIDSAMVISITRNIKSAAREYIFEKQLPIGEIYYLWFENPAIDSIKDGPHAWRVAKQIDLCIGERNTNSKKGILHIFFSGPVSIMFHLGKMSLSYGKGYIYDYDMEKTGAYYPALSFTEGDWI